MKFNFIFLFIFSSLFIACGGDESDGLNDVQEEVIESDSLEVDPNYVNESELYTTNEMGTPFEELVAKFKTNGTDLTQEDMDQLRASDEYYEENPPFTMGRFELENGQVLAFGFGFIADAVHVTGATRLAYYNYDGVYLNTALSGVIDEYEIFKIQDNFIGIRCEYMEFEEGEYVMESTGNTIIETEYFVESEGKLKALKDEGANLPFWRNHIFAKHGYIFKSEKYTKHFGKFDWYKPKHDDVDHLLSIEEKALADFIKELENK